MINLDLVKKHDQRIKEYADEGKYKYHFDVFYLNNVYPYINSLTVNRFIELMRHFTKLLAITDQELLTIKMNLHLID